MDIKEPMPRPIDNCDSVLARKTESNMPAIDISTLCLNAIPTAEDGTYEFKSSATSHKELKDKIARAASGFANSGGGCFLAGVDDSGNVDGGYDLTVGRQKLSDWADQAIQAVVPRVDYTIRQIDDADGRGSLDSGKVVLAIAIQPSESAPHMANDSRYYIRAGAHTLPASAFIVESLWARRTFRKPMLTHAVRLKPNFSRVVQIGVVAMTSAPAIEVEFNISRFGGYLKNAAKHFPIRLPIVDQNTPFFVDSAHPESFDFGDAVVTVKYKDIAGNLYEHRSSQPLIESITPFQIGTDPAELIAQAIDKLAERLPA